MRLRPTLAISLATSAVLALAGCGAPPPGAAAQAPGAQVAAIAPTPNCAKDGLPPRASIAPDGITTSRTSWPSGSRMSKIKTLKVGVSGDALLWGASDPKNGDITGFDVDVAKRVADELGVPVEYVVLPLSGRLPALKSGAVDLVAERLSMTCDRWLGSTADPSTYINMSSQYYQAGQRLLIRSDARDVGSIEDLKSKEPAERTVCVVTGSTSLTNAQKKSDDEKLDLKFVAAADSGQCLVKFQEGEVAAISADDTTLAGFAAQDPNARVVGDAFTTETYGLGTSATYPEFTRFVNAVIQQMREDGSLQKLYAKWMARNVKTAAPAVPAALYGRTAAGLKADRQPAS